MGTSRRGGAVFNCLCLKDFPESHSLRQETEKYSDTFISAFFSSFFPLVIPFLLLPRLVFLLHFPWAFHILIRYSLSLHLASLRSFAPMLHFWLSLRRCLFVLDVFAQIYKHCVHCNVCICWDSIPEFKSLSPQIWFFLSVSLLLHNSSPYPFSRSEQEKTGQASSPSKSWFQFCLTYALNPCVIFQVIPALSTKTYCLLSFRGGISH